MPAEGPRSQEGHPKGIAGPRWPRVRISIATTMLIVLTASLAAATFTKTRMLFDRTSTDAIDYPAVFVLAITLTGIAIGGVRRYGLNQTLLHISTAFAIVSTAILFAEIHARLALYWLEFIVAFTVAVPFAVQALLLRSRPQSCEKRRIKRWTELVILAHLNVALAIAGTTASVQLAYMIVGAVTSARSTP